MGTTFGELKTRVSTVLQDPSLRTFTEALVEELIQDALVEVGRFAPEEYTEDIDPVVGQLSYQLRYAPEDVDVTGESDTDLLTSVDHGLTAGTRIKFTALTGGTGLSLNTTYYVISSGLTDDDFKIATTFSGSAVNFTSDVTATSTFRRIGTEDAIPEIELVRVEIWDPTETPDRLVAAVQPASRQPRGFGDQGWYVWNGILTLPVRTASALDEYVEEYVIRVWGYSPYLPPVSDADVISASNEVIQAMLWYIRLAAIDMLLASRDLFTQWQTRSGNTDMSPAALMNQRSIAEAAWNRRSRSLSRLRSDY